MHPFFAILLFAFSSPSESRFKVLSMSVDEMDAMRPSTWRPGSKKRRQILRMGTFASNRTGRGSRGAKEKGTIIKGNFIKGNIHGSSEIVYPDGDILDCINVNGVRTKAKFRGDKKWTIYKK